MAFLSAWSEGPEDCCDVEEDSRENHCSVLAVFLGSLLSAPDTWHPRAGDAACLQAGWPSLAGLGVLQVSSPVQALTFPVMLRSRVLLPGLHFSSLVKLG